MDEKQDNINKLFGVIYDYASPSSDMIAGNMKTKVNHYLNLIKQTTAKEMLDSVKAILIQSTLFSSIKQSDEFIESEINKLYEKFEGKG